MMDDLDELGYEEIKHRFDRGDYHDPTEIKSVKNGCATKRKSKNSLLRVNARAFLRHWTHIVQRGAQT